jgi:hypothetical protein
LFLTGGDDGNDAVVGYNYNDSDDGSEEDDEVDDGDGGGDDIDDKDGGDDAENDDRLFLECLFLAYYDSRDFIHLGANCTFDLN